MSTDCLEIVKRLSLDCQEVAKIGRCQELLKDCREIAKRLQRDYQEIAERVQKDFPEIFKIV